MRFGGGAEAAPSEDAFLHLFHNLSRVMAVFSTADSVILTNVRTMLDA